MKRLVPFTLILVTLTCALAGCAREPEPTPEPTAPPPLETPAPSPTPTLTPSPTPTPEPTPTPVPHILPEKLAQYADYITRNSDFCGWLTIPGGVADDPVVYGSDYEFYVDYDIDKQRSAKGAVFVDYRNTPDNPLWQNTVIYAHHMRDGSMFGSLEKYNNSLDFLREHPVFTYDTLYGERRYQIFAVLIAPMDYNYVEVEFDTPEDFIAFTDLMRSISLYTTDLAIAGDDEMITLSTCWYDFKNARFVIQAVRLPDDVEAIPASYTMNENRRRPWLE